MVCKSYGKSDEDYHLWAARTQAALEAKKAWNVVRTDVITDEETLKTVATARATVMQGLGDRPLRLCLIEKDNPHRIRLRDRNAVSNTAARI